VSCDGADQAALAYAASLLLEQAFSQPKQSGVTGNEKCNSIDPMNILGVAPDTLRSVFRAVSLEREIQTPGRDRQGRFDESAISWDCSDPWVSRMACELRSRVEAPVQIEATQPRSLRVVITHDVDWVTPFGLISVVKSIIRRKVDGRPAWLPPRDVIKPSLFLKNLERLLELELRLGVHPWFFMFGGTGDLGLHSNSYGKRSTFARRYISLIQEAGGEIGLHGSYRARERDSYAREAAVLSEMTRRPVIAHRNHYLRFDPRRLWSQLEDARITVDFSLCFRKRMGFRVPVTGPFHPFDWTTNRGSNVWAIPTVAMDRVWWPDRQREVLSNLRQLLANARAVGGAVAVLIHPEILVLDPRWYVLFEEIVSVCREAGACLDTTPVDLFVDAIPGEG